MKHVIFPVFVLLVGGASFWLGRATHQEETVKSTVEKNEKGTYTLNQLQGYAGAVEYIVDDGSTGNVDYWSLKAWESHPSIPLLSMSFEDRNADDAIDSYLALVDGIGNIEFAAAITTSVEGTPGPPGFSVWLQDKEKNSGARYYDFNLDGRFDKAALKPEGKVQILVNGRWEDVVDSRGHYDVTVELSGERREFTFQDDAWVEDGDTPGESARKL